MPCRLNARHPLPPIMALEKSPPKSTSALAGASLDIRSSNATTSPSSAASPDRPCQQQHHQQRPQPPSRCLTYSVRGNESWISPRDMDHLKHLTDALEQPEDTTTTARNGDGPRYTLPRGCRLGKMVGEGAANAVFEFQLPDGSHLYHQKTRMLPPPSTHMSSARMYLTVCRSLVEGRQEACGR